MAQFGFPQSKEQRYTVGMGNKDKGKREAKKPAKKQPKSAPARKREDINQIAAHIGGQATKV
jgi:hypothetical protein